MEKHYLWDMARGEKRMREADSFQLITAFRLTPIRIV